MIVTDSISEAHQWVRNARLEGLRIGLVPTMGALHAGHYALVEQAVKECDYVAATIFVNPTQFGPREDLSRYPRTLEQDLAGLRDVGCGLVFTPTPEIMYPSGFSTYVQPPTVAQSLEGTFRPDHFRGVATVVLKLFQILPADQAFFGCKDYQQLRVIQHMVRDLNLPIQIRPCETVREADGLAMSSRNRYLSPNERKRALALHQALTAAEQSFNEGERDVAVLGALMHDTLRQCGVDRIDYAAVVDREHLQPLGRVDVPAVALIAAHVGTTRLIDNREIG